MQLASAAAGIGSEEDRTNLIRGLLLRKADIPVDPKDSISRQLVPSSKGQLVTHTSLTGSSGTVSSISVSFSVIFFTKLCQSFSACRNSASCTAQSSVSVASLGKLMRRLFDVLACLLGLHLARNGMLYPHRSCSCRCHLADSPVFGCTACGSARRALSTVGDSKGDILSRCCQHLEIGGTFLGVPCYQDRK